jgi:hypothetical protein
MKKTAIFSFLLVVTLSLCGCYQAHSDDDLRTVPITNNPNLVPDGGRNGPPGALF